MKRKIEMQYKRLFELIINHPNKIWELSILLKAVNFILPNDMVIKSHTAMAGLVRSLSEFKVFRCHFNQKIYYIFRKSIPEEE